MREPHYRWDAKKQRWKADAAEFAIVFSAVALVIALLTMVLLLVR
jgi:hypothetical protein